MSRGDEAPNTVRISAFPAPATPSAHAVARGLVLPAIVAAILLISLPMLVAPAANLTSDESLYQAEAYNIAHGHGATYPSGEPITHRAPLFPAMLAPAIAAGGPDAAYAVTKVVIVIDALLIALIALRLGGALAAAVAGVAAASSAYLQGLGATLYLDPAECMFLLLSLLALHEAARSPRRRWFVLHGAALGLAFLVKESAIQWLPLAVCAWLAVPGLRSRACGEGAWLAGVSAAAVAGWWWVWVYAQTSSIYLLGAPTPPALAFIGAGAVTAGGGGAILLAVRRGGFAGASHVLEPLATPIAVALLAGWGALILTLLTITGGWPYPSDYVHTLPAYMSSVAPQAQPYVPLLAAWGWGAWRAIRGDGDARLLMCAGLLFAPFAADAANRGLQLRDALPLVYLSYVLLGLAAADVVRGLGRIAGDATVAPLLAGVLALAAVALIAQQAWRFQSDRDVAAAATGADAWNNPFEQSTAAWMRANLPAGSHVLTSRLYFSRLYVDTGGAFSIRQLPTVRVDIDPGATPMLQARSNLFRWGDTSLRPTRPGDQWLYLKQFPGKGYWVGLSQQELIEYIAAHDIDYVILTGDDIAFSSSAYAGYFSGQPAFTLVHDDAASATEQLFVYRVDRTKLAARPYATVIPPSSLTELQAQTHLSLAKVAQRLGMAVRVPALDSGITPEERAAALAGAN